MQYPAAFGFSGVYPLWFLPCAGLCLWILRRFQAFLSSSARPACASSFCFCSAVCLRSIFGLAAVANRSVKPTRLRRAAYFLSLEILRKTMKLLLVLGLSFAATTVFAQQSTSKAMSFDDCLKVIRNTATQLGVAPVNIAETSELRMVKFPTADGSVLVTCSKPDRKMVMTVSKK